MKSVSELRPCCQYTSGFGSNVKPSVELRVDDRILPLVLDDQRRSKLVVAEPAAALPVDGLADPALVVAVYHLLHARNDVSVAVLTEFNHDPTTAHFLGDRAGRARTGKGVEHPVTSVRSDFNDTPNEAFRLRSVKNVSIVESDHLLLSFLGIPNLIM
jgi:hypothetical protein